MLLLIGWMKDLAPPSTAECSREVLKSLAVEKQGDMTRCALCSTQWWLGPCDHEPDCPAEGE